MTEDVQNQQQAIEQDSEGTAGRVQEAAGQTSDQAEQAKDEAQDAAGQFTDQMQETAGGLAGSEENDGQGQGEGGYEDHSHSDSNATTVENDKSPKGPLADLLNLEILPSPDNETTTLESGNFADNSGAAEQEGQ